MIDRIRKFCKDHHVIEVASATGAVVFVVISVSALNNKRKLLSTQAEYAKLVLKQRWDEAEMWRELQGRQ